MNRECRGEYLLDLEQFSVQSRLENMESSFGGISAKKKEIRQRTYGNRLLETRISCKATVMRASVKIVMPCRNSSIKET